MLAEASRWVAAQATQTILAARHPEALASETGALPWVMDWQDQCAGLSTLVPMPEFDLVLAWLHQSGLWMAEHLQGKVADGGRFVHIHSFAAADPQVLSRRAAPPRAGIESQNIILGRKQENGRGRWLTKREISQGVIAALQAAPTARVLIGDSG